MKTYYFLVEVDPITTTDEVEARRLIGIQLKNGQYTLQLESETE